MTKRLHRSRTARMIGGVCGGLAEYFDVDVVLIRALFVITTFGYGIGFIAYIVLWIIAPEQPKIYLDEKPLNEETFEAEVNVEFVKQSNEKRRLLFGSFLVFIGIILFLNNFIPALKLSYILPMFLVGFGGYLLYNSYIKKSDEVDYENE